MKYIPAVLCAALLRVCAMAHPMGNFSINHYSKIELRDRGTALTYILDFAEIPTSELQEQDAAALQAGWARGLAVTLNGQTVPVKWSSAHVSTMDGAGGMAVMRVVMKAELGAASKGTLVFRDTNYANRTGWKEVVISHSGAAAIDKTTHSDRDVSKALTVYPADLTVTPPQDLEASVTWHGGLAAPARVATKKPIISEPKPAAPSLPAQAVAAQSFTSQQGEKAAGTVKRGDYLSRMLQEKHFGFTAVMIGLLAAFGLGSVHALSPGHGKTIVAAYLVGSRGTLKHAGILGLTVTFTHTVSVFLLGIGVLFFQKYVIPEKVVPVLGAISGLSIVVIGAYLLYQRTTALVLGGPAGHGHSHSHGRNRSHSHARSSSHAHSHEMPENITLGSLLGLGISGGLVPCPSALVLLLSAISLGQVALGLALLGAFSTGLAVVLMGIGGLVLYGRHLLPRSNAMTQHPFMRLLPVFSSVVVIVMGLLMTLAATGVIQPLKVLT